MTMVAGRMLPNKHIVVALTYIYGIGRATAKNICAVTKIDGATKVNDLSEAEIQRIRDAIAEYTVEGDLRRQVSIYIKELMAMGCYRGIRHRRGLPVRGQGTKNNARTRKSRRRS